MTGALAGTYDESSLGESSNSFVGIATLLAAQVLRALPRVRISRAVGRLCEQPLPSAVSRAVTNAYCQAYRVDLDDAELPPGAFPSFDAFFTRQLKPGARTISSDALVSPADGVLSAQGTTLIFAAAAPKKFASAALAVVMRP